MKEIAVSSVVIEKKRLSRNVSSKSFFHYGANERKILLVVAV